MNKEEPSLTSGVIWSDGPHNDDSSASHDDRTKDNPPQENDGLDPEPLIKPQKEKI